MRATKTIYKTRTTSLHTKPTTLTIRPSSVRQQTHTQVWQLTTSRLNTQQQKRGPSTKQQPEESTTKTTTIAKNRKGTQFLGSLHAPQWARTPAKEAASPRTEVWRVACTGRGRSEKRTGENDDNSIYNGGSSPRDRWSPIPLLLVTIFDFKVKTRRMPVTRH